MRLKDRKLILKQALKAPYRLKKSLNNRVIFYILLNFSIEKHLEYVEINYLILYNNCEYYIKMENVNLFTYLLIIAIIPTWTSRCCLRAIKKFLQAL